MDSHSFLHPRRIMAYGIISACYLANCVTESVASVKKVILHVDGDL